jgi:hypothetical protein
MRRVSFYKTGKIGTDGDGKYLESDVAIFFRSSLRFFVFCSIRAMYSSSYFIGLTCTSLRSSIVIVVDEKTPAIVYLAQR